MALDFLLTHDERELFDNHLEAYLHNAAGYVWMNILGYVVCTLLFFDYLTWAEHLFFGASAFLIAFAIYVYTYLRQTGMLPKPTQSGGVGLILVGGFAWSFWWVAYFYALYRWQNELMMQQFVIINSMVSLIAIAMAGRFHKVVLLNMLLQIGGCTIIILSAQPSIFQKLLLQIYVIGLGQLIFMRVLNQQLFDLFRVRNLNNELVEALKQKNIALEQSNLSQARYLSAASHDLRQPLHALALLTSDAQRRNQQPEVALTLNKVEEAIDSLSASFNAMLNLSRLDAGVVKPDWQTIQLQRAFDRIGIEFEEVARQKNLQLRLVPTQAWVRTDEGMLHSILANFVSNAIRYTEQGKIVVGVRRRANGQIRVMVLDTGDGIPAHKAKQIFQEYQRLEYAEQRVKGGVGLGLAISERMAKLLGAQLFVQSIPEKGSCFGLILNSEPHAAIAVRDSKAKDRELHHDYLKDKRIAILDDDETAVDYLAELLGSWGLNVSVILSTDMFAEMVGEEGPFDMVLSDYHLGLSNETGLDVLLNTRKIQSQRPPIGVLITGDTTSELAQAARECNVEIVYKPLSPVRLRAYLNNLLMAQETAQN